MPTNRRDFVKASAAIAAVAGARAAFGQPVTGYLPNPPSDSAIDDLALEALNAAQAAGASYADARIGRYRRQFVATRERNVTGVNDSESFGIGVRALYKGSWGF
ncbi:MAG TPA: DNA gyrase modulator, partial [Gemmatimonadaceae bacterium]